jgi:hypothetical protein
MSKTENKPLASAIRIFELYQNLGYKAMLQIQDEAFHWKPEPESNSIYLIVKHLNGNMLSRWTDFLVTDGEKPNRNRDNEFEDDPKNKEEILELYKKGWETLLTTLHGLTENQLSEIVFIRSEAHSVLEAIFRQIAHYSYHVGQIVYLAKAVQSNQWQTLSIAKNKSQDFNNIMKHQ